MKNLTLTALLILALITACKKEKLPAFYFQCKVDGVLYEPDNCANCKTRDLYGDSLLSFGANKGNEALGFAILKYNISTGTYPLGKIIMENKGTALYDNTIGNPTDIFRTDSLRTGVLNITELDKVNKIIVGTFYFDAYNIPQNKIVRITDGKFRLNYKAY